MQTIPVATKRSPAASFGNLNYEIKADMSATPQSRTSGSRSSRWAKHSLSTPMEKPQETEPQQETLNVELPPKPVVRRFRKARITTEEAKQEIQEAQEDMIKPVETLTSELSKVVEQPVQEDKATKKPRRKLRPRMALITLTPNAIEHLRALLDQPEPQLIRIGVRNRGCSGLTYHLEYVTEPGKFDELVEQDGVKVFIDSKALFSIVGSEMDWIDDKLSSRFIFKNPNSKGTCGCGESFMV